MFSNLFQHTTFLAFKKTKDAMRCAFVLYAPGLLRFSKRDGGPSFLLWPDLGSAYDANGAFFPL